MASKYGSELTTHAFAIACRLNVLDSVPLDATAVLTEDECVRRPR